MNSKVKIFKRIPKNIPYDDSVIWNYDIGKFIAKIPKNEMWDLIVTSPPYNIGKNYESRTSINEYIDWQASIIKEIVGNLKKNGSICWQVGNYVENGYISPLDYIFHPIFNDLGLKLRNRIVWHFGHGLHQRRRFSGRYEVVLWYTKTDDYTFNLDAVRVPPKYPGKRAYKGPNVGKLSSHPLGKNPEDVWEVREAEADIWNIPNVKGGHVEKTEHPCQFPVGLVERLILALSNRGDHIFDPFMGAGSAGVAALLHNRRFWGCEIDPEYARLSKQRLDAVLTGSARFRSHARPLYDHRASPLSVRPNEDA